MDDKHGCSSGAPKNESEIQKLIRAFAEGGKPDKAREIFRAALLKLLKDAKGDVNDGAVRGMAGFGQGVLGDLEADAVIGACINEVLNEIEKADRNRNQ